MRGLFVAAGFCAHGLAGAGGIGKVMAEWIAGGEPELDLWQMDVRRFGAHYRSPALHGQARARGLRDLLRHQVPQPRARRPGGRCASSPAYDWHREHGAVFGEKSGWERVNWYAANEAAGDEALRPRGWAGMHWSPAIGAEHTRLPRGGGAVRRDVVRQDRGQRAGRRRAARAPVRQPRRARGRPDHLHADAQLARRDRVRLHGRRGSPRTASGSSPAPRSAATTWPGSAATPATACASRTSRRAGRAPGCGARGRATCSPRACTDDLSFGYMRWRELAVGDVPVRALRVTYVGELGWELYCPMEYGARAVAHAVGGRAARTAWSPAATARSTRCGSRRATACGAPTSRPTTRRTRAGSASACSPTRTSSAARRSTTQPGPPAVLPACSPTRARSRSATSPCGRAARSPAASPAAATATPSSARSPTRTCPPSTPSRARRSPSRSSATGSTARSPPSRCSIPRAPAIRVG